MYHLRFRQSLSSRAEEAFPQRNKQQQCNDHRRPQGHTSPVHRLDRRIRRNGKHASHEKDDKKAKGETVDDVAGNLAQAKGRSFGKGAVDADRVAVIETAGDAEDVGAEEAAVADGLDVEEGGVGAKRDEGDAAANEPGEDDGVDGDVQVR